MQHRSLHLAAGEPADAVAARLREALARAPVVHVAGGDFAADATPFWTEVIGGLGALSVEGENGGTGRRDSTVWTDIRFDPDLGHTFRHANVGQPLHTDGAYNAPPADVVMFWCARPAPAGGETLFLDGERVAEVAAAERPDLYGALTERPVCFRKLDGAGRVAPILDVSGRGVRLTWNYYRVAEDQGPEVDAVKEDFHRWLQERFVDCGEAAALRLDRHEAVFFRDDRVLRGRSPYLASRPGDRLLWKASFFLH